MGTLTVLAPSSRTAGHTRGNIAGQALTFKGSATDPSSADTAAGLVYTWTFGDGSAAVSGKGLTSPSYTYASAGTYTVTVTATDKDNGTSVKSSTTVTITPPLLSLSASAGTSSMPSTREGAHFQRISTPPNR